MISAVESHRQSKAKWKRAVHEDVREIGPPDPIKNPRRRNRCKKSLKLFLTTYFPEAFYLGFSDDHLKLIESIESCVFEGGSIVIAMPRGSGKTTVMTFGICWALLNSHSRYAMLICSDQDKFDSAVNGIREMLPNNQLLAEDFPEIIHPIKSLDGAAPRQKSQTCAGELTHVRWTSRQMHFPTNVWSRKRGNAAAKLHGGGLGGASIRGPVHTTPWGEQIRPDLVLVDDPSTRASAKSSTQNQDRLDVIKADVSKMSGPGKKMSVMVACTVIYKDDLAERLLDPEISPTWEPLRVKTVKSWPKQMGMWEEYWDRRRREAWGEEKRGSATKWYLKNQKKMDDGCVVYWDERIEPGYETAIESAMGEYFKDPRSFMSECQNTPEDDSNMGDLLSLSTLDIVKRISGYKRGVVPNDVTKLVAHIDCQSRVLYWMVCGITPTFKVYIVDYGTLPKQRGRMFSYMGIKSNTLERLYPDNDEGGRLRQGLRDLMIDLTGRDWKSYDDSRMQLDQGLIDAGWRGEDVEAALISSMVPNWMPAVGVGIRAKDAVITLRDKKRGVQGFNWIIQKPVERDLRTVRMDVNYWKSEAYAGLLVPDTHSQAVVLYNTTHNQSHHQNLAEHFTNEIATRTTAKGRTIDEWELKASGADNHWWDNLVGCYVAASIQGIRKKALKNAANLRKKPSVYVGTVEGDWE